MKLNIYMTIILIIAIFYINCDKDNGTDPVEENAKTLTTEGWDSFTNSNYQNALSKFNEAIEKDNNYKDAHNGAGWANARLQNLTEAVNFFSQCLNIDSDFVDAHAGLAFTYNAQKEYQQCIHSANTALHESANWNFEHDQTLNYKDLRLILAESYYANKNFSASLSEVKKLNSSFNTNVNTLEGKAELAVEIERLRGEV